MHERECKGYISFNRGVNEFNRGVNDLNRGVNHSVARQGCNLLRAAVTSAVTSQGCCCGNLQIHPLDLGQVFKYMKFLCRSAAGVEHLTASSEYVFIPSVIINSILFISN